MIVLALGQAAASKGSVLHALCLQRLVSAVVCATPNL